MVSFSDEASILRGGYKFWPDHFSLAAYRFLGQDIGQILHSYGISIIVTVAGTALSMIIIALYAYPISRPNFPQAKFFTFFAFFTMLFSGGLVPWYLVYVQVLDLKDTLGALIVPQIMSAFWVLVTRTFFQTTIPGPAVSNRPKSTGQASCGFSSRSSCRSRFRYSRRSLCSKRSRIGMTGS